jgi:amino acid transporter
LYAGSRVLYGLAIRGQAPKIFANCTKNGLPLTALLICVCCCRLHFGLKMDCFVDRYFKPHVHDCFAWCRDSFRVSIPYPCAVFRRQVFFNRWMVSVTTIGGFINWFAINLTFLFFCTSSQQSDPAKSYRFKIEDSKPKVSTVKPWFSAVRCR